jgi:hypothetical protein
MNALEIIEKLDEVSSRSEYWYGDLDEEVFGKNKLIDKEGGYEGGGEYAHRVIYFTDHDVYIKLEGTYSSYGGMDIDDSDYEEVRPTERLVTFYE